jgi:hypothetical protein
MCRMERGGGAEAVEADTDGLSPATHIREVIRY